MDPLAQIKATYFQECEEQLGELENGLSALKDGDRDPETVNAIFRAAHSIKGGAGAFGLDGLVKFAHVLETVLDDVRSNRIEPDDDLINLMLRASDMLSDHVLAARDGKPVNQEQSDALLLELKSRSAGGGAEEEGAPEGFDADFAPVTISLDDFGGGGGAPPSMPEWTIVCRPKAALYAHANEIALLLRELGRLGTIEVTLDESQLPPLHELDAEEGYLSWTIKLQADCSEPTIREVFEFVDGDCDIEIRCEMPADAGAPDLAPMPEVAAAAAPVAETETQIPAKPDRSTAMQTEPATPAAAPNPCEDGKSAPAVAAPQTIRVDVERMERLVDLVGELVINQAMLAQRALESGVARASGFANGLEELEQLTREIQESAMAIRAQPVKSVFQRMTRLVRELSAATGKQVRLVTEGESTEVDKTVIERIAEPLTHMIRNAIDHGLEKPDARIAAGKPAEGVVKLQALHRSGRIVIEVSDDGAGINRKRVKAIAVEKGLIPADAALTDEEIDDLIFMPGFSTATEISDISGRGVGMDVVRRSIQALGGRIVISSRPGLGSTFSMSLPLTLAVMDGMVVSVCDQTLVIPLSAVVETLRPKAEDLHYLEGSGPLIRIRDMYVPAIDVALKLEYRTEPMEPTSGVALFAESETGQRAALVVDTIQGQRQVVIKSMEQNYKKVDGIAAATILGDGRVALIVDVDAMLAGQSVETHRPALRAATG